MLENTSPKAAKDEVTLVDLENNDLGKMDKLEAHKHPAKLHRAISCWLVNKKGEILLQKRSQEKIVGANWWANSVCGNVWPKETFFDCLNRRLREELGINQAGAKPIYKFVYKAFCNEQYGEYELDQVYLGKYDGEVRPNPSEVSEYFWIDAKEFISKIAMTESPDPEQTLLMGDEELKEKTGVIKVDLAGIDEKFSDKTLFAPWAVMMTKDERFIRALEEMISDFA
jgi:isopentenyl-diphosphate Delta-isomerase